MPSCHCTKCYPAVNRVVKTIIKHLRADENLLANHEHSSEFRDHLQNCIDQTILSLNSVPKSGEGE